MFREDVRVADLFIHERFGIRPHIGFPSQKIMDTVLRWDTTRQETGSARRTHRDGDEKVLEPHSSGGETIDIRCSNFRVTVTSGRPDTLVVSENEYDIDLLQTLFLGGSHSTTQSLTRPSADPLRRYTVRPWREAEPRRHVATSLDRGLFDRNTGSICGARIELEHRRHRGCINHALVADGVRKPFSRVGRL